MTSACVNELPGTETAKKSVIDASSGLVTKQGKSGESIVILDGRALNRECFVKVLEAYDLGLEILAFEKFEDWKAKRDNHLPVGAVVMSVGGTQVSSDAFLGEIREMTDELGDIPIVVMSESDDLSCILQVLDSGARGFVPTSLGMAICVEAIRLAMVGGTFVPAEAVMAMRHKLKSKADEEKPMTGLFTERQAEIAQALRRGKANKIIAYELNLRESTVKVHIRNIMKKLKATNRTEVAYKINELLEEGNRTFQ